MSVVALCSWFARLQTLTSLFSHLVPKHSPGLSPHPAGVSTCSTFIFVAGVRCNIDEDRYILAWAPEASVWTWRKAAGCAAEPAKRHRPLSDPRTAEALIGSRCLALGSVSGEDGRRPLLGLGVKEDALVGAVA